MEKAGPFDCCCSRQSVASPSLLVSRLAVDILSTFCGLVHGSKLLLRIFEFGVLLFDCFVCSQSVTCLKRFTRYGHYAGEVEDIIIGRPRSCLINRCAKIRVFSCDLMTLC